MHYDYGSRHQHTNHSTACDTESKLSEIDGKNGDVNPGLEKN